MTNESIACKGSCAYIFLLYSYFYRLQFRGFKLEPSNQSFKSEASNQRLQIRSLKSEASNQSPQTKGFKPKASN